MKLVFSRVASASKRQLSYLKRDARNSQTLMDWVISAFRPVLSNLLSKSPWRAGTRRNHSAVLGFGTVGCAALVSHPMRGELDPQARWLLVSHTTAPGLAPRDP